MLTTIFVLFDEKMFFIITRVELVKFSLTIIILLFLYDKRQWNEFPLKDDDYNINIQ